MSNDVGNSEAPEGAAMHEGGLERREALRRFGVYAACTAPAMTVLLASRQTAAGSFFNNGDAHRRGNSGLPGGGGGGGCGFSC